MIPRAILAAGLALCAAGTLQARPTPDLPIEAPAFAVAQGLSCIPRRVIDGDTLDVICEGNRAVRVRLRDVDAPELRGACEAERVAARRSRAFTRALVDTAKQALIVWLSHQSYGRIVGHIETDGLDLGSILVKAGLAKPWPHTDSGRALEPRPSWCLTAPLPTPRPARQ